MKISIPKVTQWSLISAEDLAKGCTLPVGQTPEIMFDCCSTTSEANCAVVISTGSHDHMEIMCWDVPQNFSPLYCSLQLNESLAVSRRLLFRAFLAGAEPSYSVCNFSMIHSYLILFVEEVAAWAKLTNSGYFVAVQ